MARRALRAPEAPTGASAATEQRRDRGSRDTKRSTERKIKISWRAQTKPIYKRGRNR